MTFAVATKFIAERNYGTLEAVMRMPFCKLAEKIIVFARHDGSIMIYSYLDGSEDDIAVRYFGCRYPANVASMLRAVQICYQMWCVDEGTIKYKPRTRRKHSTDYLQKRQLTWHRCLAGILRSRDRNDITPYE